jgi:glutamyl-tRNA(Gln) amidotransferase subunit E
MEDMTLEDYQAIGLRSGLEIHQQLDTKKKLFCRCPVLPYSEQYDAEILRHMRPTLSELGEYDGTALMEFKTKKDIIYQIRNETVCTYEMDDTPPFELNEQALDIALEVTMLLNCNLVSEVHIARKQYLDGSIPTGFQRTTILGVNGWLPYKGRKIGVYQLGLEEDACIEVTDIGHTRTYRTDRLGIPLIEPVTYPDMRTPQEVADVAQMIRWLTRATGKVRTGIGAAREDVNVSVEGGRRVEIKGVPRIPLIPLLVHNEAFRQLALIEIQNELGRRKIMQSSFKADTHEVTDLVKGTSYYPVAKALKRGFLVKAVVLRGYRGILSMGTQLETTFAHEISDRVRVIACLDLLPNIAHSDQEDETISSTEWTKIKKLCRSGDNDAVVLVWGDERDSARGAEEIAIRAEEALDGIPNETRQALPGGANRFERILPGADRMYPDTDLPPLAITEERIERIKGQLPELPWDREKRYVEIGLNQKIAKRMSTAPEKELFDRAVDRTGYEPSFIAHLLLGRFRAKSKNGTLKNCDGDLFVETLEHAEKANLIPDAILPLFMRVCGEKPVPPLDAVKDFSQPDVKKTEKEITKYIKGLETPSLPAVKLKRHIMGRAREKFTGHIEGKRLAEIVDKFIDGASDGLKKA